MKPIYRVIVHPDHPQRARTLDRSLGGPGEDLKAYSYAREQRIEELYRGELKPIVSFDSLTELRGRIETALGVAENDCNNGGGPIATIIEQLESALDELDKIEPVRGE